MLMKKGFWIVLVILVVVLSFLAWQSLRSPSSPSSGSDVKVVSSTYPLAFVASQILGTEVANVETVVPLGAEPHEFEPTPSQIAKIYDSEVFLFNGAGLDLWADRLQADLSQRGVVAMKATAGLDLLDIAEGDHPDEDHAEEEADAGGKDPHFWLDPQNMVKVAERFTKVMSNLEPENTKKYYKNLGTFRESMQSLDLKFQTQLASCKQRDLVISHNFFAYPEKKYGLSVLSISGISPDAEPTLNSLTSVVDLIRQKQLEYIFTEELVTTKPVEVLQQETGVGLLRLNPIEGLTEQQAAAGEDYVTLMEQNLDSLKQGLSCN